MNDLLIENASILDVKSGKVLEGSNIYISNGTITGINVNKDCPQKINLNDNLVIPGLINAHTHAAMTLLRSYADDLALIDWLTNHIWPKEAQIINPETVYIGTLIACYEMAKNGITTFVDMYFYEDFVAKAAEEIGLRALIGEGVLSVPTPHAKGETQGIENTKKLIEKYKGSDLISPIVAPHAPYTCSDELLRELTQIAIRENCPLHIHLSESEKEFFDIQKEKNLTPTGYLEKLGVFEAKTFAAHVNYLTDNDITILKDYNVSVVHCPESNAKLASGICPVAKLIQSGVNVALGTDGAASNNNLDILGEMDFALKLQKISSKNPQTLKALDALQMATSKGAASIFKNDIGSIEVGKWADFLVIDRENPSMLPGHHPVSDLVYSATPDCILSVCVNGKWIIKNKEEQFDKEKIIKLTKEVLKRYFP
ncbi:5-methylthioadenosine/S-adenosylhomocysteinedeaminase [Thermodesulfobium narugense DSM 14796]|uniref:5-methylthioadenosine/S-adenosylhomocysteine deaminase n=1 Tax=Thermodesulfobium narugense DSM 14796 TaxID=747365 RepID=M1E6D7_9BACT|nr:amidohydrolase [Thermodesulfobium narugense]AEE13950.1 5-methylthioadenosine/S-adenosylhomocysteinedeaminase [Thermodesulfobium narugense DSM 14796]